MAKRCDSTPMNYGPERNIKTGENLNKLKL